MLNKNRKIYYYELVKYAETFIMNYIYMYGLRSVVTIIVIPSYMIEIKYKDRVK